MEHGVEADPLLEESDNAVLALSLKRADRSTPPDFGIHPSQVDADEGALVGAATALSPAPLLRFAQDTVPTWRLRELTTKEDQEREEEMELEMADDVGRRRAMRLRGKRQAKQQKRLEAEELYAGLSTVMRACNDSERLKCMLACNVRAHLAWYLVG